MLICSVRFRFKLPSNLRRRKSPAFGPERLTRLAGSGNRGAVVAILAATDVGQKSGAVAADFVGSGDRVHFVVGFVVAVAANDANFIHPSALG